MPQNVCAKKVMKPTKACATTTHEFSQFCPLYNPMREKIQVQNFVFLTSELKSTHNFSLEIMFCSYIWDNSYFHTFGTQIGVRSQTLSYARKYVQKLGTSRGSTRDHLCPTFWFLAPPYQNIGLGNNGGGATHILTNLD